MFGELFTYPEIKSVIRYVIGIHFSQLCVFLDILLAVSFKEQKYLIVVKCNFCIFSSVDLAFKVDLRKIKKI